MWYYIVVCATLCVSFSSKFKATIFPKDIQKSKASDKSIQARKKLFCHLVNNYLWNVLCMFLIKIESTYWCKIKEQDTQTDLLYRGWTVRSRHWRCFIKKAVLKNFAISTGNTYGRVSFEKVADQKACNFIKKTSQNWGKWGFFDCFNGPLLHWLQNLRSRLHDGIKLQGPSHSSIFLFLSWNLLSWTESWPPFENPVGEWANFRPLRGAILHPPVGKTLLQGTMNLIRK